MVYKEMIMEIINRIEDEKLLESIFYIISKIWGRGI